MKCSRCGKELTAEQAYVYQGRVMCEDCIMEAGLTLKQCDPWASYVDTAARKRRGMTGAAGLTEGEAKLYDLIKAKGRLTRDQAMKELGLSPEDLQERLVSLMHSELVKESGEAGQVYLVPIPVPRS